MTRIFYILIGFNASIALLLLYYAVLRLNSSLGLLLVHNSANYLILYGILTFGSVILFGISFSLFIYQWRRFGLAKLFHHGASGIGAVTGIISSACPVCGSTLLSGIGIIGGLSSLPFQGLEIKAIAFIFMAISVGVTMRWLSNKGCDSKGCPQEIDDSYKKSDRKWMLATIAISILLFVFNIRMLQSDSLFDRHFNSAKYSCLIPHL